MLVPKVPHILYGGDYNPEQWPEEMWLDDVRLMREAGVNLVSVGVFAWARLEPTPGAYDFGWLDRVMDLLAEHGIYANLATATASPPPWLARLHPESLPVTQDGVTLWPGARQHYCPSSAAYRAAATALAREIATRYRAHPALAMWHVGNEYGCHVSACYCDASAAHFRTWLRARYGTLDALNAAWGTAFWSQRYADWDEIQPPRRMPAFPNPTQHLDFWRFSSDALLDLYTAERDILREVAPDVPVTTNLMGFFKPLNYWRWAAEEDIVANDAYPDPADQDAPVQAAMAGDLMRSLGRGRPWVLMEQTPSQVNWRAVNVLKRPGQMRLWSLQAVAHGADGVMFFQWRASRAGAEKFHGGMVPHGGTEHARVWREVAALGAELRQLDGLQGAQCPAEVAIVLDWESWWALELDSKPSSAVRQMDLIERYYRPLHTRNIAVSFVEPTSALDAYRVVVVPNLYLMRDGIAGNLRRFVVGGGRLVVGFFSGIVDEHDHVLLGGYPAPLRELLGLRVEELDPFAPGQVNALAAWDGASYTCDLWADVITLEGAEALATFESDFYAGRPAITLHRVGSGAAYYIGTRPEPAALAALLRRVCEEAGVAAPYAGPDGVEIVARATTAERYVFVLNHRAHEVTLEPMPGATDAVTGQPVSVPLHLGPYGAAVLRVPVAGNSQ
jgi:beta-galactosidase